MVKYGFIFYAFLSFFNCMIRPTIPIEEVLQHRFQDKKLLIMALTHRSFGSDNNERLELLGDRILDAIISEYLYKEYPKDLEGALSKRRGLLVQEGTLVKIAHEQFNLSLYLRFGSGEKLTKNEQNEWVCRPSILADAFEAIIAAIFLDTDFEYTRKWVLTQYQPYFAQTPTIIKDSKTRLQELCNQQKLPLPAYELLQITGQDHAQTFHIQASITLKNNTIQTAIGSALTRKKAEQIAATELLSKAQNVPIKK
jgi:ribonuclease-3